MLKKCRWEPFKKFEGSSISARQEKDDKVRNLVESEREHSTPQFGNVKGEKISKLPDP
jgi:hypothetical protein